MAHSEANESMAIYDAREATLLDDQKSFYDRVETESLAGGGSFVVAEGQTPTSGHATFRSAMSALVLAVLGAGQLTLPYAMRELGLGFGFAALLGFALLGAHSLQVLTAHSLHFQASPTDPLESYTSLVVRAVGQRGTLLCDFLLAVYAWGGALSFLIILKGELAYVAAWGGPEHVSGALLMPMVAAVVIFPLSTLEDLSGLKRISPLGCIAALFITLVVLLTTPWSPGGGNVLGVDSCTGPAGETRELESAGSVRWWPRSFLSVAAALPLLSFALNSSWAYVPIFDTMRNKTAPRTTGLIAGASTLIISSYALLSTFGYITFCEKTDANILESLGGAVEGGSHRGLVLAARAALAVQLTLALPMRFFVCRKVLSSSNPRWQRPSVRRGLSGVLVAAAVALAALPLPLATVLGVVSSVCASLIIYILPAVIDLRLGVPGPGRKVLSTLSLPVGVFVLLAGLAANLLGVAVGS